MSEAAGAPIVYVIDDDDDIRTSIAGLLKSEGLRSQTFRTAQEFLERQPSAGPTCLVLDVRLPGMNGLDVQQELASASVPIPIIFITGHGDIPMTVKAMKSGAVEFLTKPFRDQDLLVRFIRRGSRSDRAATTERADRGQDRYATLTSANEVMALVVTGMLSKQIASTPGPAKYRQVIAGR